MKIIAHRGLMYGPDKTLENNPQEIVAVLKRFDCEIGLYWADGWFLGHDEASYPVDIDFLKQDGLWIHCKNVQAIQGLCESHPSANYFWHENDTVTITSKGFLWQHCSMNKVLSSKSIVVLPELHEFQIQSLDIAYGVCTDYTERFLK